MARLAEIEGIGETYSAQLEGLDITSIENLLEAGGEKSGRARIAQQCGIKESLILDWVNRADLARIKGVGSQYADLLECAGVDTVAELAQRNAENLFARMQQVNTEKKRVRKLPTADQVSDWVAQAKQLPRKVMH